MLFVIGEDLEWSWDGYSFCDTLPAIIRLYTLYDP